MKNKTIIFIDTTSKKKFIIKSNIKTSETEKFKRKIFHIKKITLSIKSYISNKKNEKNNIIKRIKKFKKKYER